MDPQNQFNILVGFSIFLVIVIIIEVVLYFLYDSRYNDLVKNENALCPTPNCAYASENCNYSPFKIVNSQYVCKDTLYASKTPGITGL